MDCGAEDQEQQELEQGLQEVLEARQELEERLDQEDYATIKKDLSILKTLEFPAMESEDDSRPLEVIILVSLCRSRSRPRPRPRPHPLNSRSEAGRCPGSCLIDHRLPSLRSWDGLAVRAATGETSCRWSCLHLAGRS